MRALYRNDETFTLDDLIRPGKPSERSNLRKYLTALVTENVLEVTDTKNGKASHYRMLRNLGPTSPVLRSDGTGLTNPNAMRLRMPRTHQRPSSQRALIWKAVRVFGQRRAAFTAVDVAVLMARQGEHTLTAIREYLGALAASGHLEIEGNQVPRAYRVKRDTGPLYPILRRSRAIYDPNEQREYAFGEPS